MTIRPNSIPPDLDAGHPVNHADNHQPRHKGRRSVSREEEKQQSQSVFDAVEVKSPSPKKRSRAKHGDKKDLFLTAARDGNHPSGDEESGFYSLEDDKSRLLLDQSHNHYDSSGPYQGVAGDQAQAKQVMKNLADERFRRILKEKKEYQLKKEQRQRKAEEMYQEEARLAKANASEEKRTAEEAKEVWRTEVAKRMKLRHHRDSREHSRDFRQSESEVALRGRRKSAEPNQGNQIVSTLQTPLDLETGISLPSIKVSVAQLSKQPKEARLHYKMAQAQRIRDEEARMHEKR